MFAFTQALSELFFCIYFFSQDHLLSNFCLAIGKESLEKYDKEWLKQNIFFAASKVMPRKYFGSISVAAVSKEDNFKV